MYSPETTETLNFYKNEDPSADHALLVVKRTELEAAIPAIEAEYDRQIQSLNDRKANELGQINSDISKINQALVEVASIIDPPADPADQPEAIEG